MREMTFTFGCGFGGSGGGALGALRAQVNLLGVQARFRHVGSFDKDPRACANYRYLTGHEETCLDVREATPGVLRPIYGNVAPDVILGSAPCQGLSGLLSEEKSREAYYQELNSLGLLWTRLMLETWPQGPRLVAFENVSRITSRGKPIVAELHRLFRAHGYVTHDGSHELGEYVPGGHYDAGELGGLAQHRQRWIFLARDPRRCAPLIYKPPVRRVRAVGEALGPLPMPGDPAGGSMHALPRLSPMNWLRLAMIPAGGDWRRHLAPGSGWIWGRSSQGSTLAGFGRRGHAGDRGPQRARAVPSDAEPREGAGERRAQRVRGRASGVREAWGLALPLARDEGSPARQAGGARVVRLEVPCE